MATAQRALVGGVGCRSSPSTRRSARQPASCVRRRAPIAAARGDVSLDVDIQSLSKELVASVSSATVDDAHVLELIHKLASAKAPVTTGAFDGVFEVVWSDGTMAWRALVASLVQRIAGKCRAGQRFSFDESEKEDGSNSALNFAELFDGFVMITAGGVFFPDTSIACTESPHKIAKGAKHPLPFSVQISAGAAFFPGLKKKIELPISGPGAFAVLYSDEHVRVFKSSGGLAVQVPSDWQEIE